MIAGPELFTETTAAFDVIDPLVAVIFVVPIATPVTTPVLELIVANAGADEAYANDPPEMKRAFASLPRASIEIVPVTATMAVGGDRSMLASTCDTFSVAPPVIPCADAWMDVMPFAADSARALVVVVESMRATEAFVEAHVNVIPLITFSSVSRATARYMRRLPSDGIVNTSGAGAFSESNETSIRVIGVSTVRFDTPTVEPLVARICAEPMDTALTAPVVAFTVATAGAVDDQARVGCAAIATPLPSTADAV